MMRITAALVVMAALAACSGESTSGAGTGGGTTNPGTGGSGTGGTGVSADTTTNITVEQQSQALRDVTAALTENPNPITAAPTDPTAVMQGAVVLAAPQANLRQTAIGAMSMEANFDTARVRGIADRFSLVNTDPTTGAQTRSATTGRLDYTGQIDLAGSSNQLTGDVVGAVELGDSGGTIRQGAIKGSFYETDRGLASSGSVTGRITSNAGNDVQMIGTYGVTE